MAYPEFKGIGIGTETPAYPRVLAGSTITIQGYEQANFAVGATLDEPGAGGCTYVWTVESVPASSTVTTSNITNPTNLTGAYLAAGIVDESGTYVFGLVATDILSQTSVMAKVELEVGNEDGGLVLVDFDCTQIANRDIKALGPGNYVYDDGKQIITLTWGAGTANCTAINDVNGVGIRWTGKALMAAWQGPLDLSYLNLPGYDPLANYLVLVELIPGFGTTSERIYCGNWDAGGTAKVFSKMYYTGANVTSIVCERTTGDYTHTVGLSQAQANVKRYHGFYRTRYALSRCYSDTGAMPTTALSGLTPKDKEVPMKTLSPGNGFAGNFDTGTFTLLANSWTAGTGGNDTFIVTRFLIVRYRG